MDCVGTDHKTKIKSGIVNKIKAGIVVAVLLSLLILIRAFEDVLFYDPLLDYFKSDYKNHPLPEMNVLKMQLHFAFRYFLNTIISLGILWFVFKDLEIIKLSSVLYLVLFILLLIGFNAIFFTSEGVQNQLPLFYIRRFLIQPLFLLIFAAAFYFQKNILS